MRKFRYFIIGGLLLGAVIFAAPFFFDCSWRELFSRSQLWVIEKWNGAATADTSSLNDSRAATSSLGDDTAAARIRELTLRLVQKDAEIYELEQALREFEKFRRLIPSVKMFAARLIGRQLFGDEEVVIDLGAADGIREGWGAAQGNVLAGVVGLVGENSSYVLLTSHPGCLVPARAEKSREVCAVRGLGAERAIATFYTNQTATAPGEKLLTSGMLGKLPAGLIIGTVEGYPLRGKEMGTMEVTIKLDANFAALEHLLIVSPLAETRGF